MILVDSNILIDVADDDPVWGDWSAAMLAEAAGEDASVFNQVVLAEFGQRFPSLDALFAFGDSVGVAYAGFDEAAAFQAGRPSLPIGAIVAATRRACPCRISS